jgi:hypothetical protein
LSRVLPRCSFLRYYEISDAFSGKICNVAVHNGTELLKAFAALMQEYHFEKPHYALGIYTPSEVLNGKNPKQKFTEIFKEAAIERRKTNKLGCEEGCKRKPKIKS